MRLFGLDIVRVSALTGAPEEMPLLKRVHRLEMQVSALEEAQESLRGMQGKLRAQFNGAKGGRPAGTEGGADEVPRGDKVALRQALGIFPGRRT